MRTYYALPLLRKSCLVATVAFFASTGAAFAGQTVPLAVAMQSLVPSGYVIVYPHSVDISAPVDKPSGKGTWYQQVNAIAGQLHLDVRESGNVLSFVEKAEGPSTASDKPVAPAPTESAEAPALAPETKPLEIVDAPTASEAAPSGAVAAPMPEKVSEKAPEKAPETTVEPPNAVRVVEGTLMGTPVLDARTKAAQKAASVAPVAQPALAPALAPAPQVSEPVKPAPAKAAEAKTVPQKPAEVTLSSAVSKIAPAGYKIVYASNVDKSALVAVPSEGDVSARLDAVSKSAGVRIEDVKGTLFINRASQAVSLDESYPKADAVQVAEVSVPKVENKTVEAPPAVEPVVAAEPVAQGVAAVPQVAPQVASPVVPSAPLPVVEAPVVAAAPSKAPDAEVAVTAPSAGIVTEKVAEPVVAQPVVAQPVVAQPVVAPPVVAQPVEAAPTPAAPVPAEAEPVASPPIAVAPDMTALVGSNFDPNAGRPVAEGGLWRAERGANLHDVLDGWCQRAGVQLVWSSQYDYPMQASISLNDSFEGAVRTLLSGFATAAPQPVGRLHRQANFGSRVLIIETRGNSYGE